MSCAPLHRRAARRSCTFCNTCHHATHLSTDALRIWGARMDDGDGRILTLQQQRRGHAHNVAAPHHRRALATQLREGADARSGEGHRLVTNWVLRCRREPFKMHRVHSPGPAPAGNAATFQCSARMHFLPLLPPPPLTCTPLRLSSSRQPLGVHGTNRGSRLRQGAAEASREEGLGSKYTSQHMTQNLQGVQATSLLHSGHTSSRRAPAHRQGADVERVEAIHIL